MVHEDYKEMIPAFALSALDRDESQALALHLSGCAECTRELASWESTTAELALSVASAEPSPVVRERLLKTIREENGAAARSASQEELAENNVVAFRPRPNVWSSVGSFGAIAAALLFLALLVSVIVLWQQNRATQARIAVLSRQLEMANSQLQEQRNIIAMMTKPGSRMMDLAGTDFAPSATARLAYDKTGHAMLFAQGLPAAPNGKEYQLWFIVGEKKMPGKSFAPDSSGSVMMTDEVPDSARSSAVFAITLEPKGGVDVPTGDIFLLSRG